MTATDSYTVTLTAAELDIVSATLGYRPTARKVVKKPAATVDAAVFNTGNAEVDNFMRRKHDPKWRPNFRLPRPSAPPKLTASQARVEAETWHRAVNRHRADVGLGPIDKDGNLITR